MATGTTVAAPGIGPGFVASAAGGRGAGCKSGYSRIPETRRRTRRRRRTGQPWRRPRGDGARVSGGERARADSWGLGFWRLLLLGRWDLEEEEVVEAPTRGEEARRAKELGKEREGEGEGQRVRPFAVLVLVCDGWEWVPDIG
jgi:hypothetical protein